jgi:hypothetical protein
MLRTTVGQKGGISNEPPEWAVENLKRLCEKVLEPLRTYVGGPVRVTSGYRSHAINALVSRNPNSQHTKGEAADIVVPGMPPAEVVDAIIQAVPEFDQLINEWDEWVHVSYREGSNRREVLKATGDRKKPVYVHIGVK